MRIWQKVTLIGCGTFAALGTAAVVAALLAYGPLPFVYMFRIITFDADRQPWTETLLTHPAGTPVVVFKQKVLHPFLAEYDYKVQFGDGEDAVDGLLPTNTGGRTRMNAYWYPADAEHGPSIRLQNYWGEYLLRLGARKTYRLLRYRERVYAGEVLDPMGGYTLGEVGPADGPRQVVAKVGGKDAADVTDTAVGRGPGEYLGRIEDGRFLPAAEAPERQIPMLERVLSVAPE